MSTKAPRRSNTVTPASGSGAMGWDVLTDFGREQLAMAMEASCAMFRGFEAMRSIQQQAAQQAAARHEAAKLELRESRDPAGLMAIPVALMQQDWQSAIRYWQELAAAALETQTEIIGSSCQLFDAENALRTASAMEALETVPGVRALFPLGLRAAGLQRATA